MNLFYQPHIRENVDYLDPGESQHCVKVLRKKRGDLIDITDGKGFFYKAVIAVDDPRRCVFRIENQIPEHIPGFQIHIAIAPTKNIDRTEWFVEKAVEIGVHRITFIECRHSERTHLKSERMQKVAVSAMKQSLKASLPLLSELISFEKFVKHATDDEKFIACIDETDPPHLMRIAKPGRNTCILIGPEGDFSTDELANAVHAGYRKVSLGKSRLRTETAGLAACHIINLINL